MDKTLHINCEQHVICRYSARTAGSRLIPAIKQHRRGSQLGKVTTWEPLILFAPRLSPLTSLVKLDQMGLVTTAIVPVYPAKKNLQKI
ncbi:hypothetical protein AVEN_49827-1 [Araneus ventricosus]|uniref:Uncharacterized protein n=1 Tax=Araneus ventricosus TaxID=182803 RepID=A0A4Y2JLM3_ARAVE|nr:hypothetical protein AVEN_49827-1 [Araneus ventricosus]